jgi:hypothetical protein
MEPVAVLEPDRAFDVALEQEPDPPLLPLLPLFDWLVNTPTAVVDPLGDRVKALTVPNSPDGVLEPATALPTTLVVEPAAVTDPDSALLTALAMVEVEVEVPEQGRPADFVQAPTGVQEPPKDAPMALSVDSTPDAVEEPTKAFDTALAQTPAEVLEPVQPFATTFVTVLVAVLEPDTAF